MRAGRKLPRAASGRQPAEELRGRVVFGGSIVDAELGKDADVGLLDVWQPAVILIAFALVLVTVSVKRFSKTME